MKNILFGLISISVSVLAAAPNLTDTPTDGKTVFQAGQTGAINVKGTIKTSPEILKYVVFASTDGGYTGNLDQEILTLPIVTIPGAKGTATPEYGFNGQTPPKVYVKKVNSAGTGVEDLVDGEVISYKLNVDPEWIQFGVSGDVISDFKSGVSSRNIGMMLLMAKTDMDNLITSLGSPYILKLQGTAFPTIVNPGDNMDYSRILHFSVKIYNDNSLGLDIDGSGHGFALPGATITKIEEFFSTPKTSYADLSISVKVN